MEIIFLSVVGLFIFAIMWGLSYALLGVRPFIFMFEESTWEKSEDRRNRTGRLIPSLRGAITFQLYEYMFGVTYIKVCPYTKCGKSYMTESRKQSGCSTKHSNNYRQEKRRGKRNT